MSLTITGNVIEDENLGLTTLATDSDATDADDNVTLSAFQNSISTSSSIGAELKVLGIYPDTTTNGANGTTTAIGISEDAIVSTTDQNLQFTDSSGGALNGVPTGITALDGNEILLYSDPSNPHIVLGKEANTGTVAFALLLQPTSGGATIWVVQYEALTNTNPAAGEDVNTLDLSSLVYVSGSSSSTTTSSFNIGTKMPGQNYWLPFMNSTGTATVLVTGLDASTSSPDTVNTSSVGDGSNTQSITPGGALRFDFVSSFSGGSTKDKTFLTDSSLHNLVYLEGNEATFDISQVTPTGSFVNVQIIAQDEGNGTFNGAYTSTSTNLVAIVEVKVWTGGVGGTLIADSARAPNLNNGITFSFNNGIVTVNHLTVNETVDFFAANGAQFDQFVAKNVTGTGNNPGFDILNVTQTQTQTTTTTDTQEVGSHIIFEDSVPSASGNTVTKAVDEDALSANLLPDKDGSATATGSVTTLFIPGTDTPLSYKLSADYSSLTSQNLSSHGTALAYSVSIDGASLTATGSGGATVFTLTLDTSGNFNFTLSAPVDHAPGADDSSNTTIDFSGLVLATDADGNFAAGDTATAATGALTVTITDDVPADFNPEAIVSADNVQDAAGSHFTGSLINTDLADGTVDPNSSLTIKEHAGADGFGDLSFSGTDGSKLTGQLDGGAATNLQAGGNDIYLFGFGTGTLTATTDPTGINAADDVFTITLDPDAGTYNYNMLQAIGNGSSFTFSDFADVPAGNYAWFSLPFNPTTKQPVSPGKSVIFTGLNPSVDTVNPSSIGVGTDKQAVAPGKAIRLDFVDNVHSITTTTDLKHLNTLGYADHYEVNNSGFTLSQVSPNGKTVDIRLDAYEVPQGTQLQPGGAFPTDTSATHEAITDVKIVTEDSSGHITAELADFTADGQQKTFSVGGVSQTVTAHFAPTGDSSGVDLTGLKLAPGEFILVSTATGFDRLLATNIGTVYGNKDSFDMGAVSVSTFSAGQPISMAFDLALQDYDAFNSGSITNLTEAGTGKLNINLTAPTV
ncbi:hypothetical protein [Mesorhizobium sp. B1-1-8]|uniref:T1SS-143 repeat domain-containing protein n=1 Tax=Mesorhizobium sp. B1-1-8 TaxID=2589976 RepID=UPI001126FE2B|nr:hypothetical protein [Mesorhizobium sp. B1-1-8]UCI05637.1 hypothetical protein FJ974_17525 [Mesorhizobium sp. B1-1-8]